jgi:hypothetical protein
MVVEPQPGDPIEAWGMLNPAAARGPDGEIYLYPPIAVADGASGRRGPPRTGPLYHLARLLPDRGLS